MNFTANYLKDCCKDINSIFLKTGLIRNNIRRNIKRSNILNLITVDNYGPVDRSIRFELYENSAEGIESEWIINGSLLRFDDIQNEYLEMTDEPYYTIEAALESLANKVNAIQIVTGMKYIVESC